MTHKKSRRRRRRVRETEKKYKENRNSMKKQILKLKTEEQMSETNSSQISPSVQVLTSRLRKHLPKSRIVLRRCLHNV